MDRFELSVDFNGIALFDPERLAEFCGGSIAEGTNLWERFTTTDEGDRVLEQGIVVPVLGINDGGYDVVVRGAGEATPIADPIVTVNRVFPLTVERRLVAADMAVLWDWEWETGWCSLSVEPGHYGVEVRGWRRIVDGCVERCGYEFVLTPATERAALSADVGTNMQVLTLDPIVLSEIERPVEPADFEPLEARLGAQLPDAFKRFYLDQNGGYPASSNNTYLLAGFVPIRHGALPIERLIDDCVEAGPALAGHLPFANDAFGNLFVLSLRADDYGRVLVWSHEESDLHPVAESFAAFVAGFRLRIT